MPAGQGARRGVVVWRKVHDGNVGDRRDRERHDGIGVSGLVFKFHLKRLDFHGTETGPVAGEHQLAKQGSTRDGNVVAGERVVDDDVGVEIHGNGGGIGVLIDDVRRQVRDVRLLHEERIHVHELDRREGAAAGNVHNDIDVEETVRGKVMGRTATFDLAGANRPRRRLHPGFHGKSQVRGESVGHVHGLEEGVDFPRAAGRPRPSGMHDDLAFIDIGASGRLAREHAGILQRRTGRERIAAADPRLRIIHRRTGEGAALFVKPEAMPPGDGDIVERAVGDDDVENFDPALVEDDLKLPHRGGVIIARRIVGERLRFHWCGRAEQGERQRGDQNQRAVPATAWFMDFFSAGEFGFHLFFG